MIMSKRHDKDLYYNGKTIIAPRYVEVDSDIFYSNIFYIHIVDFNCTCVDVWQDVENTYLFKPHYNNVSFHGRYRLYINTKGLYFNLGLWNKRKCIRVYIGE